MKLLKGRKRKSRGKRDGVAVFCAGNALVELRFFGDLKRPSDG